MRHVKADKIAQYIKKAGNYRWVGIYDVGAELVSIVAYKRPRRSYFSNIPENRWINGRCNSESCQCDCG
jgi:hypothetical protein